uniref:Reverse transcriptase Ty1/copia-type domain-containing protein n=1 Tax=Lactuca sativa TaxID=4236 RepID=A0A9R1UQ03_LACSA|nr:hypothetical protein LSAT_V11C800422600 [Lactuca sativa]
MIEESLQKNGSLGNIVSSKPQVSVFNSKANDFKRTQGQNRSRNQGLQCKNSNLKGHTIDRCYKLIGYPKDFTPRSDNNNQNKSFSVNSSSVESNSKTSASSEFVPSNGAHLLTDEQYSKFLHLISEHSHNEDVSATSNMAGMSLFQCCNSFVSPNRSQSWIVDSGANQHMIASESHLQDVIDVSKLNLLVKHPNGSSAPINKIGNLHLSSHLTLFDVFGVPDFNVNLLSVHKLCKDSRIHYQRRWWRMVENLRDYTTLMVYPQHSKLGHPADQALTSLKKVLNFGNESLPPSDVCHRAKQTRESFSLSQHTSTQLGELVHLDVWGPYRLASVEGFKYFLTVVDDFTRATWVFLLKSKTEELFIKHLVLILHNKMELWRESIDIFLIMPTSVLNGSSPYELIFKKVLVFDHLRVFGCLCFASKQNISDKLSERAEKCILLGYCFDKKAYKLLSLDTNTSFVSRDVKFYESVFPYKLKSTNVDSFLNSSGPSDLFSYDVFNTNEYINDSIGLDELRVESQLDGTDATINLDDISSGESVNHGGEAMVPPTSSSVPSSSSVSEEISQSILTPSVEQSVGASRTRRESYMPVKFADYVVEGKYKYGIERSINCSYLDHETKCFISNLNKSIEPKDYKEALSDPNWVRAMNEEMKALHRNHTWEITNLPKNRKPIGCKWVFKIKYKSNGEVERYKARLVAKGYNQREGIDFEETFSPVAKIVTVRIVISLSVHNSWPLYQLDINNAFLYGDLTEDVYMSLPPGYYSNSDSRVCKLTKSLYGLKQAPRKWNEKLCASLFMFGFQQSISDYSLFIKKCGTFLTILLVYVDDIILTGNSEVEIKKVKEFMRSQFLIKDLGILKYFLGIEVISINDGLCLNQRKYCLELLHEYGMLACKPVNTPLEVNFVVSSSNKNEKENFLENKTEFQKQIGKLIYLTITRLDISYAVQVLSQYMHKPRKSHLNLAFRLLRYLKNSPGKGVALSKSSVFELKGYVDADWAKCLDTRRSVSVTKQHNRLKPETVGPLMCSQRWLRKELQAKCLINISIVKSKENQKLLIRWLHMMMMMLSNFSNKQIEPKT